MEVFGKIKKEVKNHLEENGLKKLARNSSKILNLYLKYLMIELFQEGQVKVIHRHINIKFYLQIVPIAYVNYQMYKNMMISSLNANYMFNIKASYPRLKEFKFQFKPMSKLKYFLKKSTLDTFRVYKLIQDYEKSIL